MEINGWDQRYRSRARAAEDFSTEPTPLLVQAVTPLVPGTALDLGCGTGRNALWLAARGWDVTGVDGSIAAIEILRASAKARGLILNSYSADLEKYEHTIEPAQWYLIAMCYYLQRDLFAPVKQGVIPGGMVIAIVHIAEPGESPTAHRLRPGELETYFGDWEILHRYEGKPKDHAHQRPVAEILARKPAKLL